MRKADDFPPPPWSAISQTEAQESAACKILRTRGELPNSCAPHVLEAERRRKTLHAHADTASHGPIQAAGPSDRTEEQPWKPAFWEYARLFIS